MSNVLHPCTRLIESLDGKNAPLFSDWPDRIQNTEPNRQLLLQELAKLKAWATALEQDLKARVHEANHTTEYKREIVFKLTELFREHFPAVKVTRGTHDRYHGTDARYVAFIRRATAEIYGEKKKLGRAIKDARKIYGR